jgi:hypothetical protein
MTLRHRETEGPSTSEVVHLAQRMYERDRAEQEREKHLADAAEEIGIPSEYLAKATAQLNAQRSGVTRLPLAFQSQRRALLAAAFGLMVAILLLGFSLTLARVATSPVAELAPPTVVRTAPPPPAETVPPPTRPGGN